METALLNPEVTAPDQAQWDKAAKAAKAIRKAIGRGKTIVQYRGKGSMYTFSTMKSADELTEALRPFKSEHDVYSLPLPKTTRRMVVLFVFPQPK